MKRVVTAVAGFLVLCVLLVYVFGGREEIEPPPKEPDRVLLLLNSSADEVIMIEQALERANYGEAKAHLNTLRARLSELSHTYREREARAVERSR